MTDEPHVHDFYEDMQGFWCHGRCGVEPEDYVAELKASVEDGERLLVDMANDLYEAYEVLAHIHRRSELGFRVDILDLTTPLMKKIGKVP